MNWLEHYTALIQLISAVNFAYIVTHFPSTVFAMIFDVNKLLNNKLFSYKNQVSADIESLKVMQPIKTEDGRTNERLIKNLRKDYNEHKEKWNEKEKDIKERINTAKSVKGSKCIFLNISLFCLFTLFNIATYSIFNNEYMLVFTLLQNLFILLYSVYLTYIMWEHKWDHFSDVQCYRRTGSAFLLIVLLALFISCINGYAIVKTGGTAIPNWLSNSILYLSIILPLYPCIISILFIMLHEKKIKSYINTETTLLIEEQVKLHKRKEDLERMDSMFTPSTQDLGITFVLHN